MTRRIVDLLPEAIADARTARDYYLSKSPQVEESFRHELERGIELIREHPETWPRYVHATRRLILKDFPYSLVYTTDGTYSLVVAIAHAKRKPAYWMRRLP